MHKHYGNILKQLCSRCLLMVVLGCACLDVLACTSLIVSGKRTKSGKPLLYKNRDTDCLDNRLEWFEENGIRFIGLVNAPCQGGEVWAGENEYGFAIMNTAVYNFSEDSLHEPVAFEDREGVVMYRALSVCRTVNDFLTLLDTLPKPLGVQANFGVIDREGGALYVETNNWRYVVLDVNLEPSGYRVQTNFAFSGDSTKRSGWERYLTALDVMAEWDVDHATIDAEWVMRHLSRSYRHALMQVKSDEGPAMPIVPDQDFIPRRITSAVVVVDDDVMWTWLGYPATAVAVPAMVCDTDRLPRVAKRTKTDSTCVLCQQSLEQKYAYVFPFVGSNGSRYVNLQALFRDSANHPALIRQAEERDSVVRAVFVPLYESYKNKQLTEKQFYEKYHVALEHVYEVTQ